MKSKSKKPDERHTEEISLDQVRDLLYSALQEQNKQFWVREVYASYLIYTDDSTGKHFKRPWSILDGEVQLGDEVTEVEKAWIEARAAQAESENDETFSTLIRMDKAQDIEGTIWEVTIVEPGFTKNGWYHSENVLRDAAALFEGTDVNLYELPDGATHLSGDLFDAKSLLIKNKAGVLNRVRFVAGEGLKGVITFIDSAKWIGKNLLEGMRKGQAIYGLSYDSIVRAVKDTIQGRNVYRAVKFLAVDSLDIVSRPAAGGRFIRAVASIPAPKTKEDIMDKKTLWNMIQEKRPDLLKDKDIDAVSDEEIMAIAQMAMEPKAKEEPGGKKPGADPPSGDTPQDGFVTKDDLKILQCGMALDRRLGATDLGLPEKAVAQLRKRFEGKIFTTDELDGAIGEIKDLFAGMSADPPGGTVPAGGRVRVGIDTLEKVQIACDRMFGITKEQIEALAKMETTEGEQYFPDLRAAMDADYNAIPRMRGIRELYEYLTGDHDVSGRFNRSAAGDGLRAGMDINSATFTYLLGNTLGRRLVSGYREMDYKTGLLISVKKNVKDFRSQEAVLVGGLPDIADVDPEAADYVEITAVTDEENTYTVGQKGNLLTITRKLIVNNDISIIDRIIKNLTRAAARTHGKYVWNMVIDNDNCTDGTAIFTNPHGNLGATGLSHATALVAYLALGSMTEKDSSQYLGLLDDDDVIVNLVVPFNGLFSTSKQIEEEEFYYSTNDLTDKVPNTLKGKVKAHRLSILNGDANDWYMFLPPNVIDIAEMGYLNGREDPELFVADSPQSEQVFVADKIRYKIRHEYAGALIDYRGAYKAVVT
ncbi:MAG: hypothetical protein JXA07_04140 [Spirochaetes bacterium]|nr:hypothetical protein [Spirochaetota bacterium]